MRLLLFALAACATAPTSQGGPRGLRATEHLSLAREHDDLAAERQTFPASQANQAMTPGSIDLPVPMPYYGAWDSADSHQTHARRHRGQAAALHVAFDQACKDRSGTQVTESPLTRFEASGFKTENGVTVVLGAEAGPPGELLAAMRCHRAWLMITAVQMDDDALDLPGLVFDAQRDGDNVTVAMTVTDPKLIPELQRRVTRELEARQQARR
jgi:hypothetical protein